MSIKECCGSEINFTDELAKNKEWMTRLLTTCGLKNLKGIHSTRQDTVAAGRRLDNAVYDDTGQCIVTIETTTGRVDFDHIQKSINYPVFTKAKNSILICESITEEARQIFNNFDSNCLSLYLVVVCFVGRQPIFHLVASNALKEHKVKVSKEIDISEIVDYGDGTNHAFSIDSPAILKLLQSFPLHTFPDEWKNTTLQRMYCSRIIDLKKYGEVLTPRTLVEEILDKLPEEIFKSNTTTFFDPACGSGTFLIALKERLLKHNHSEQNIYERLYGVDLIVENAIITGLTLGSTKNIKAANSLDDIQEWQNMKFDVVIGNPPFNKNKINNGVGGTTGDNTFYRKFILKGLTLLANDKSILAMITPIGIVNEFKKSRFEKYNIPIINFMTRVDYWKYTTCWFIMENKPRVDALRIQDPIISNIYSLDVGFSIEGEADHLAFLVRDKKLIETGKYKVIAALPYKKNPMIQYGYSNQNVYYGPKFAFRMMTSIVSHTITEEPILAPCTFFIRTKTISEAEALRKFVLNNKAFQYMITKLKYQKHRETALKFIRTFDLSQIETGYEYPKEWNLTKEEIKIIEETVK